MVLLTLMYLLSGFEWDIEFIYYNQAIKRGASGELGATPVKRQTRILGVPWSESYNEEN